jgi:hypothetical protein
MMSEALNACISSLASEGGTLPSTSPGGATDLFGPALAPASPSAPPAKARRPMTSVTCGLRGHLSSPSAALEQSLVSRLKRRLDGVGSTLFSLTWKRKATPAGRPYYQLAASARRTSETGFGSWPTPTAQDDNRDRMSVEAKQREMARDGRGMNGSLALTALAAWPTPMAGTPAQNGYNEAGNNDSSRKTVEDARSSRRHGYMHEGNSGTTLTDAANLAAASGPTPSGSPAQTGKPGQLSPVLSSWLMGYPLEWYLCAPNGKK